MRIYTVHMKRTGQGKKNDPDQGLVLIKEGFSWPAFFLSGLWALWHRMWFWAAIIIAANIALSLALSQTTYAVGHFLIKNTASLALSQLTIFLLPKGGSSITTRIGCRRFVHECCDH
jgi:hypothetical protein